MTNSLLGRLRAPTNASPYRAALIAELGPLFAAATSAHWLDGLQNLTIGCGPINAIDEVFADPQVRHRGMHITLPYAEAAGGKIELIGNPIKYSKTPVDYRRPPPKLGEHSEEVLEELLGLSPAEIAQLRDAGVI